MIVNSTQNVDESTYEKPSSNFLNISAPNVFKLAWFRRKRAYLGFKIFARHKSPETLTPTFNKLAYTQRMMDRTTDAILSRENNKARQKNPDNFVRRKKIGFKSKLASVLSYISPTMVASLGVATITPWLGFGLQFTDMAVMDAGEAFLDSLEDHRIDITNPEMMERALNEESIMKSARKVTYSSVAIEMVIAASSLALASSITKAGEHLSQSVSPDEVAETVSHSVMRIVPDTYQSSVQKGCKKALNYANALFKETFSFASDKGIDVAGGALKYSARSMQKAAIHSARKTLNDEGVAVLRAIYGHAAAHTIMKTFEEKGLMRSEGQQDDVWQNQTTPPIRTWQVAQTNAQGYSRPMYYL